MLVKRLGALHPILDLGLGRFILLASLLDQAQLVPDLLQGLLAMRSHRLGDIGSLPPSLRLILPVSLQSGLDTREGQGINLAISPAIPSRYPVPDCVVSFGSSFRKRSPKGPMCSSSITFSMMRSGVSSGCSSS